MNTAPARLRAWCNATSTDPATVTATFDGNRIVAINGSAALAADAMAISDEDVAVAQAELDADIAAEQYPAPDVTVPTVDAEGNKVGTARLLVNAVTLDTIVVLDSASPQRPWSEQKAAALASLASMTGLRDLCRTVKLEIAANKDETQAIVVTGETAAVKSLKKELVDCHIEIEHLRDIIKALVKASE